MERSMTLDKLAKQIKEYFKDVERLNRLKGFKSEFSKSDIQAASNLALLKINSKHAVKTELTIDDCPEFLLLLGTAARLMESEVMLKARNTLAVADGSGTINREGNIQLYDKLKMDIVKEFEEELFSYKTNLNFMSGWQ